jgi:5-methylcytosine-specific restriction endonuclease McrA
MTTATKSGRFVKGQHRTFKRTCDRCGSIFLAATGNRKRCPSCCRCDVCGKQMPNATDRFCGNSCSGKWKAKNSTKVAEALAHGRELAHGELNQQRSERIAAVRKGKPRPELRGEGNPNWKGGTYGTERHTAMSKAEYAMWRRSVYERDAYRCVACGETGRLHAHHIKPWSLFPESRYDVANGATLCVHCHRKAHTRSCNPSLSS